MEPFYAPNTDVVKREHYGDGHICCDPSQRYGGMLIILERKDQNVTPLKGKDFCHGGAWKKDDGISNQNDCRRARMVQEFHGLRIDSFGGQETNELVMAETCHKPASQSHDISRGVVDGDVQISSEYPPPTPAQILLIEAFKKYIPKQEKYNEEQRRKKAAAAEKEGSGMSERKQKQLQLEMEEADALGFFYPEGYGPSYPPSCGEKYMGRLPPPSYYGEKYVEEESEQI